MLYLASKSPRRKELVAELGLPFEIIESPAPEKLIEQRWREEGRPGGTRTLAERAARRVPGLPDRSRLAVAV